MYMTVTDMVIEAHDGVPAFDEIGRVVGGIFCVAAEMQSPWRPNVLITAMCNDEGHILNLPIYLVRKSDMAPIAGNIVVYGTNRDTGDVIALTADEAIEAASMFAPTVLGVLTHAAQRDRIDSLN